MLISEMSSEECRDLLSRQGFGRLACAHQNRPYIVPIYFAYEPDHLYGFTTLGQKVEWMRSNPLVCVEVDDVLSHFRWSSVVVVGRYEELPDTPQYSAVRLQAQLRLEKRALWWQTAYPADQARVEHQLVERNLLLHSHRRDQWSEGYRRSSGIGSGTLARPGAGESVMLRAGTRLLQVA